MWSQALAFHVNFCPGIKFWEVNFARALGFCRLNTKCVKFDKKVNKNGLLTEKLPFLNFELRENLRAY